MSLDDYSSGELLDELNRRGDMPRPLKANYGMCGTCRKWAAYMGAYDADGHTLRCHGCLRAVGRCTCR